MRSIRSQVEEYGWLRTITRAENYVIQENNRLKIAFNGLVGFVTVISIFYNMVLICFDVDQENALNILDNTITAIFLLDFILNLTTEYEDLEDFTMIREHKKIITRYFKSGWMVIDFLASFPLDFFFGGQSQNSSGVLKLLRLARLPKVVSVLNESRVKKVINKIFENSDRQDKFFR